MTAADWQCLALAAAVAALWLWAEHHARRRVTPTTADDARDPGDQ